MFAAPEVVAFQRGQATAGLFVNQGTGGIVPQFLAAVQIEVVAAGGEVAPVERAGAHAALRAEGVEGLHAAGELAVAQVFQWIR